MLLSIVTLNYKKKELTLACINSLYEQYADEFKNSQLEVLIVDNDSQDDSVPALREEIKKKHFENMHVIANPNNSGFGAGCNMGAKASKGEFIVFLNNDTIVKDHGLIKMAEYCKEHPEVAILGGQLRNFDGSLQASTGKFYTLWYAFLLLVGGQRYGLLDRSPSQIEKVDWVKGGLLMIRRDVFDELHGFDENIFMYTEDMELCYRAHLKGLGVYFYPDVQVLHKDQGSSSKTFAIVNIYKNLLYFYKKHRSVSEYTLMKAMMETKARSLIAVGKATKNQYLIDTYEKALEGL
ncbi:MAG TPA: glycosyltransferase family 2 protein [Candidatus Saccharimonadales bacterium]|nr:glycosyltransferase family 2 protein [Candidatus Saccharimonadales bacterium]